MLCQRLKAGWKAPGSEKPSRKATVYKDASKPIPARVADLVGRMTLEEKVAQLESRWNLPAGHGMPTANLVDNGIVDASLAKQNISNGLGTYVFWTSS